MECKKRALVRCDTNYYYETFFFGEQEKYGNCFNAFLECEKMTLIECDTMGP